MTVIDFELEFARSTPPLDRRVPGLALDEATRAIDVVHEELALEDLEFVYDRLCRWEAVMSEPGNIELTFDQWKTDVLHRIWCRDEGCGDHAHTYVAAIGEGRVVVDGEPVKSIYDRIDGDKLIGNVVRAADPLRDYAMPPMLTGQQIRDRADKRMSADASLAGHIRRVVDGLPPLTDAQKAELAALLAPAAER